MLQGEFSMNVGIGTVVKDGKVQGRAMDTMVAGNVYEDFFNISALGNQIEYNPWVYSPDMFFSEMSVSGSG
jgi:predicted Zn-dependent protease